MVMVQAPSTPPTYDPATAFTVVVLQPTPRPTPPESPRVPTYRQERDQSHLPDTLPVPQPGSPTPTVTEAHDPPPQTTSAGPGPPACTMAPVPVEDARKKKKAFFFKESPGAEDGAASGSSASSAVKTPMPDAQVDQITEAVAIGAAPVITAIKRVPPPALKKGKEVVRQAPVPAARLPASRQVMVGHARGTKPGLHQRHHSTATVARAAPTRSKSTAAIVTMNTAGPSEPMRRSTSSSKLPPPSENSSTKTVVGPPSPARIASPAPLPAPPAPSPVQERPKMPPQTTSADKRPIAQQQQAPTTKSIHTRNGGRLEVTTSSDFETTDTEAEDDDSWASDYSDEEPETGNLAKEAAAEAARQRDMFAKVPTRSYTDLPKQQKSSLLTNLFHPDPAIIPYLPMHHPFRAHNSAMNLGSRPVAPPSNVQGLTSKSTAAIPLAAQVNVTQTQVGVNTSGRPGYRLKGRPEGQEVESSDGEDDEDDAVPLSKSVAQRRLEVLAGMAKKRSPQAPPMVRRSPPNNLQMTRADAVPQHQTSGEFTIMAPVPESAVPIQLPHPYNLPVPAMPATPRTTRREMLATEMSESLRRNILWERETSRRLWKRNANSTSRLALGAGERKPPAPVYNEDGFHAAGW